LRKLYFRFASNPLLPFGLAVRRSSIVGGAERFVQSPDEIVGNVFFEALPASAKLLSGMQNHREDRMTLITNIEDLRILAKRRVPRMFYDYADAGSWTESTYRANTEDFAKIKFRQRVAVNLADRSTRSTMIGQDVAMPVALAPTGLTGMQHADGEILAARAAEKFGVPFTLSTMSICSIEDVAAATTRPFWFQLYVMRARAFIEPLTHRVPPGRHEAARVNAARAARDRWLPRALVLFTQRGPRSADGAPPPTAGTTTSVRAASGPARLTG